MLYIIFIEMVLQYPILRHEMMPAATMQWLREDMRAYYFFIELVLFGHEMMTGGGDTGEPATMIEIFYIPILCVCRPDRQWTWWTWWRGYNYSKIRPWFNFSTLGSLGSSACLGNLWRKFAISYQTGSYEEKLLYHIIQLLWMPVCFVIYIIILNLVTPSNKI